jgi:hypothetical protein
MPCNVLVTHESESESGVAFGEVETDLNRCRAVVRLQRLEPDCPDRMTGIGQRWALARIRASQSGFISRRINPAFCHPDGLLLCYAFSRVASAGSIIQSSRSTGRSAFACGRATSGWPSQSVSSS